MPESVIAANHTAQSKRLRARAHECRELARLMTSPSNAARYLKLSEAYDALAAQEEQLATEVMGFNIKT
jgi:hypothetical protein